MRSKDIEVGGVYAVEWSPGRYAPARVLEKEIPQETYHRAVGSPRGGTVTKKIGVRVVWLDTVAGRKYESAPVQDQEDELHVSKIHHVWETQDDAEQEQRNASRLRASQLRARLKLIGIDTTRPGRFPGDREERRWRGEGVFHADDVLVELPIGEVEKLLDALHAYASGIGTAEPPIGALRKAGRRP